MLNQEAYQCTMALPVGGNNLAAQNQAVFCIVDFEYAGGCPKNGAAGLCYLLHVRILHKSWRNPA